MDNSIELLSSMSPKIKHKNNFARKGPTFLVKRLSLKRNSIFDRSAKSIDNENLNLIEMESSSDSYNSSKSDLNKQSLIVIPDSDEECSTNSKLQDIQTWINNVNSEELTRFSELSIIQGVHDEFIPKEKGDTVSSTFLNSRCKKFNEYFKKHANDDIIEDSWVENESTDEYLKYSSTDSIDLLVNSKLKRDDDKLTKTKFKDKNYCNMSSKNHLENSNGSVDLFINSGPNLKDSKFNKKNENPNKSSKNQQDKSKGSDKNRNKSQKNHLDNSTDSIDLLVNSRLNLEDNKSSRTNFEHNLNHNFQKIHLDNSTDSIDLLVNSRLNSNKSNINCNQSQRNHLNNSADSIDDLFVNSRLNSNNNKSTKSNINCNQSQKNHLNNSADSINLLVDSSLNNDKDHDKSPENNLDKPSDKYLELTPRNKVSIKSNYDVSFKTPNSVTIRRKKVYTELKDKSDCNSHESNYIHFKTPSTITKRTKKVYKKLPTDKSDCNNDEVESILDEIYGDEWRVNKEKVLPKSEPRVKNYFNNKPQITASERRAKTSLVHKNPYLDNEKNKSENVLKQLSTKRLFEKSPFVERLKNLCDSDSESETSEDNLKNDIYKTPETKINNERNDYDTTHKNIDNSKDGKKNKDDLKDFVINSNESEEDEDDVEFVNEISRIVYNKTDKDTYTFLESLSGSVPIFKCDFRARIYRSNFKSHKNQLRDDLFKLFNEKVFDNDLKGVTFEWSDRLLGTAGLCKCKKITRRNGDVERSAHIVLANKVLDCPERLRDTLIHEICHAAAWMVNCVSDGHGKYWKSWALKAMRTFPELPPIQRCHSYKINHKYSYKCTGCGYTIGRHRKSLDIERKRCGYCMGKFEVYINKVNKNGEPKSVATPKKEATGFALFVKENYGNYRSSTVKHGDVMKILSKKFQEIKLSNKD